MATDTLDLTDVKFDLLVAEYDQHELKCEMRHTENGCSHDVTHRITSCDWAGNVCTAAAKRKQEAMASRKFQCDKCKRPTEKCWTVRPI